MKRLLTFLLILAMVFSFIGCSVAPENEISENPSDINVPNELENQETENAEELTAFEPSSYPIYNAVANIINKQKKVSLEAPLVNESVDALEFDGFPTTGKCSIYLNCSIGYAFSSISAKRNANPFAAFMWLCENNAVEGGAEDNSDSYKFVFNSSSIATAVPREFKKDINNIPKGTYPYTIEGASRLISELNYRNNSNFKNTEYRDYSVNSVAMNYEDNEQIMPIHYSEADDCYYGYMITYSPFWSMCSAVYLKSKDKVNIDEVELQLMDISYPKGNFAAGGGMTFSAHSDYIEFEFVSLLSNLEKMLTGDFKAGELVGKDIFENGEYTTPLSYTVGDGSADISVKAYHSNEEFINKYVTGNEASVEESFVVYTYRIKI